MPTAIDTTQITALLTELTGYADFLITSLLSLAGVILAVVAAKWLIGFVKRIVKFRV